MSRASPGPTVNAQNAARRHSTTFISTPDWSVTTIDAKGTEAPADGPDFTCRHETNIREVFDHQTYFSSRWIEFSLSSAPSITEGVAQGSSSRLFTCMLMTLPFTLDHAVFQQSSLTSLTVAVRLAFFSLYTNLYVVMTSSFMFLVPTLLSPVTDQSITAFQRLSGH